MRWSSIPMPMRKRHIWACMWRIHLGLPGPVVPVVFCEAVESLGDNGGWAGEGERGGDDCGGGVLFPSAKSCLSVFCAAVTAMDGRSGIFCWEKGSLLTAVLELRN